MKQAAHRHWLALFALAVGLRLLWIGISAWQSGGGLAYPDEALHWQLAKHLIERGEMVTDDGRFAARMPLYPVLLAACAALGDAGVIAARVTQALIGALTCLVAARFAKSVWGERAFVPAFALTAVDPFAIFFSNLLLTETVFTLLLVLFVACTWRIISAPRAWDGAAGVAAIGAGLVLTRPSAIALLPAMWLAAAIFANDRRAAAQRLAIAPFILVLALLPWGIRNFTVLGSFAWLSTNGGVTLYDAQGPQADGSSNQTFLASMPELEPLGEVERDRRLRVLAVEEMQRDPAHVMQLAAAKFARTWNPFPNVAEYRSGAAAWIGASHALILYALAAGALLVARGRGWLARLAVLLGPCVYFAVLHAVYIGSVRYRVPVMPLLAVMGAGVLAALDRRGAAAR